MRNINSEVFKQTLILSGMPNTNVNHFISDAQTYFHKCDIYSNINIL